MMGPAMGAGGRPAMGMGMGMSMGSSMGPIPPSSAGEQAGIGLKPERHIAGFSIHKEDGTEIPLIFEACVGQARDTVILKLTGAIPAKAALWYGYGFDPFCNLTDGMDMAVPVFGPIPLDDVAGSETAAASAAARPAHDGQRAFPGCIGPTHQGPDHHRRQRRGPRLEGDHPGPPGLPRGGRPDQGRRDGARRQGPDRREPGEVRRADPQLQGHPGRSPESRWSDANKAAFLKAVQGGKGLVIHHFASAAFTKPNWEEFEKAIAGGWRTQGFHGPTHEFTVKKTDVKHPISEGLPAQFDHVIDELYSNTMLTPGSVVLATAYADPAKPSGTGKDEPVIWVNHYGKGRVFKNVLGHDTKAMADPNYQKWMRRGVVWAATGNAE